MRPHSIPCTRDAPAKSWTWTSQLSILVSSYSQALSTDRFTALLSHRLSVPVGRRMSWQNIKYVNLSDNVYDETFDNWFWIRCRRVMLEQDPFRHACCVVIGRKKRLFACSDVRPQHLDFEPRQTMADYIRLHRRMSD